MRADIKGEKQFNFSKLCSWCLARNTHIKVMRSFISSLSVALSWYTGNKKAITLHPVCKLCCVFMIPQVLLQLMVYFLCLGDWLWWFNNHWRVPVITEPWDRVSGCSAVRICSLLRWPHWEGPGTLPKQKCQGLSVAVFFFYQQYYLEYECLIVYYTYCHITHILMYISQFFSAMWCHIQMGDSIERKGLRKVWKYQSYTPPL